VIDILVSGLRRTVSILLSIWMLAACSQFSTKPAAVSSHNFSARYNAYFLASQDLAEAELMIKKAYKEDYNQLLPLLIPMDSVLALPARPQLESAVKKASIVAEKHQNSRWLDNSYIILGKARLYLGQSADGLEALRYVYANGRDENDKNAALIVLMKAYTNRKDYSNALGVAEYLSQQPLAKAELKDFYLTKAYLHQQNGEYLTSVAILEETFPLLKKSTETARLHFAAAQMYDRLGQYALANKHYKAVSRNRPDYDLGFYSSMNSLQNRIILESKSDLSSVGFTNMLKDRKNNDLRDRIYFTMGLLAEHRKQLPEAVDYLQKSVAASSGSNSSQKAYTYLQLARINYESLEKFELSKAYYDSALAILPKDAAEYRLVSDRKRALDGFVAQYTIVSREDSLQRLAQMNPRELDNKIDAIIEARELARRAEEKKAQEALAARASATSAGQAAPMLDPSQRRWELYDPAMLNQGKIEFRRVWGNRKLEDDWRRSSKQSMSVVNNLITSRDSVPVVAAIDTVMEKGSAAWLVMHADLKKQIPLNEGMMAESHRSKEDALYKLGKIYRFDLGEEDKAILTFNRVLNEYPGTQYRDELYYLIFLTLAEDDPGKAGWKNRLLSEYPNSTYARLISKSDNNMSAGNQVKEYEDIFKLYVDGNYTKALEDLEANLPSYKGGAMEDKYALLRVFLIGKVRGKEAYKQSITEFIRLYPTSIYLPRLKEMQELGSLSMGKR
jgi:predicted RNase H-related nuclease YkuK (DUF458 family)